MTWAGKRRFIVFIVIGALLIAFGAVIYIAIFYHTPTCTDAIQNQSEEGIDCGGSCPYLCTAATEPPTVLFTKTLSNGDGRVDAVALIENKNATAAAKDVPYTITLYGFGQALIARVEGKLDLPPRATVPIFMPGIALGRQAVQTAFLSIDNGAIRWYSLPSDPRVLPDISNISLAGSTSTPRVTATLSNTSVASLTNVVVAVIVRDASGNAIGASQTLLAAIPAQGRTTATFTWNAAFPGVPASIQVFPVIPLPVQAGLP